MKRGTIILLNGVSSSGKTTLANTLAEQLPDYFRYSIDDFDSVIERMEDRVQGKLIPVPTEHFFHETVAMFSDKGVHLIADQMLHDDDTLHDCLRVLADYPVLFVGVHCSVAELERRERERGDRSIGQAKGQLHYVHQQGETYDVIVHTDRDGMEVCASRIIEQLHTGGSSGWKRMVQARR